MQWLLFFIFHLPDTVDDVNDNIGTPAGLSSFSMASFTDTHDTPPQVLTSPMSGLEPTPLAT